MWRTRSARVDAVVRNGCRLSGRHVVLMPNAHTADVFAVGSLKLGESHTFSDDPPRPLDQVVRLIIDHEGDVTDEVSVAARTAVSDLEHTLRNPRRHRLRGVVNDMPPTFPRCGSV
jgi:hypothetical protein